MAKTKTKTPRASRTVAEIRAAISRAEDKVVSLQKELKKAKAEESKKCDHKYLSQTSGSRYDPDCRFCVKCKKILFKRDANKAKGKWIPIKDWEDSKHLKYWKPGCAPSARVMDEDDE